MKNFEFFLDKNKLNEQESLPEIPQEEESPKIPEQENISNPEQQKDNSQQEDLISNDLSYEIDNSEIKKGDYVICTDKKNLTLQDINSLKLNGPIFKVTDLFDNKGAMYLSIRLGELEPAYRVERFKKVKLKNAPEVQSETTLEYKGMKAGSFVIVKDKNQKSLADIPYQYLLSKPYFKVLKIQTNDKGKYFLDIGCKSLKEEKNLMFNIERFELAPNQDEIKIVENQRETKARIYISDNIDSAWITQIKGIKIAKIENLDDNNVIFDVITQGKRVSTTMPFTDFVDAYNVLSDDHLQLIQDELKKLEEEKRRKIEYIINQFEYPFRFYKNIITLIKRGK